MRSQNYGDKQREEQRRKKQEELWRKLHPEAPPTAETSKGDAENADQENADPATKKRKRKNTAKDRSPSGSEPA